MVISLEKLQEKLNNLSEETKSLYNKIKTGKTVQPLVNKINKKEQIDFYIRTFLKSTTVIIFLVNLKYSQL